MAGSIEQGLGILCRLHSESLTVCGMTKEKDLMTYYQELCEQFTNGRRWGKTDEKKMDKVVSR